MDNLKEWQNYVRSLVTLERQPLPSKEVQLAAVKSDFSAILYINNPSEEVQLAAVVFNGHAIKFIAKPSEKVQLVAAKKTGLSIDFIKTLAGKSRPNMMALLYSIAKPSGAI